MSSKESSKLIKYEQYLKSLKKNDLTSLLDTFVIEYKRADKKDALIKNIMANLSLITSKMLKYFQRDELHNINYLIKKKGIVKIKINYLLEIFLNNLARLNLIVKEENKYIMPQEIYDLLAKKMRNKSNTELAKKNTDEYNLILGLIAAYGAYNLDNFYEIYQQKYNIKKEEFRERIMFLSRFYHEFNVYQDKKNIPYIASVNIKTLKKCQELESNALDYKEYSALELTNIYTFKYMEIYKSYKKLMKFISRSYYVKKGNYKIINKFVIIPFLEDYQLDKEKANANLEILIDKYFEFNTKKHKNKFINLIKNVALDYPNWNYKGYSEKEKAK